MLAIKFLSRYEEFNCEQIVTFDTNAKVIRKYLHNILRYIKKGS